MPDSAALKGSARRVRDALHAQGYAFEVRRFPAGTRSAQDAAAAIGCSVGQIVKSLIFRAERSDRPLLVMVSGANRVDEAAVARELGEPVARADAAFVRARTGFAIGGVPPLAHLEPPIAFIDRDLLYFDRIWAAAGTPDSVFALTPEELVDITAGRIADVKQA